MIALNDNLFGNYCIVISVVSIVLNALFLAVTKLQRVEGFQEVLIFMRHISVGYILISICIIILSPQTVIASSAMTSFVFIPHGYGAHFDASVLNAITAFGFGCYMYTVFNFAIMFLYRYNVTCKTSSLSSIFSIKNITAFLLTAGIFSLIQAVLFYYSAVDPKLLIERLNRTKDLMDMDIALPFDAPQQPVGVQSSTYRTPVLEEHQVSGGHQQQTISGQSESTVSSRLISVFGYDYSRNPMAFLSVGIFTFTNVICSIIILIASMVVACKLRGHQESMSDKSQLEHRKLTNLLIFNAYVPTLLAMIPAVNLIVCVIRHEMAPIQEYLGVLVLTPIAALFPLMNVFLVPALRLTALQLMLCVYWRKKRNAENKENIQKANDANEGLNTDQLKALKNMTKHS